MTTKLEKRVADLETLFRSLNKAFAKLAGGIANTAFKELDDYINDVRSHVEPKKKPKKKKGGR